MIVAVFWWIVSDDAHTVGRRVVLASTFVTVVLAYVVRSLLVKFIH